VEEMSWKDWFKGPEDVIGYENWGIGDLMLSQSNNSLSLAEQLKTLIQLIGLLVERMKNNEKYMGDLGRGHNAIIDAIKQINQRLDIFENPQNHVRTDTGSPWKVDAAPWANMTPQESDNDNGTVSVPQRDPDDKGSQPK
jgi:hypothetical protein